MEMFTLVTPRGKWWSDVADGDSLEVLQGKPAVISTEGYQQKDFLPFSVMGLLRNLKPGKNTQYN